MSDKGGIGLVSAHKLTQIRKSQQLIVYRTLALLIPDLLAHTSHQLQSGILLVDAHGTFTQLGFQRQERFWGETERQRNGQVNSGVFTNIRPTVTG